jgi:hypothetical protein
MGVLMSGSAATSLTSKPSSTSIAASDLSGESTGDLLSISFRSAESKGSGFILLSPVLQPARKHTSIKTEKHSMVLLVIFIIRSIFWQHTVKYFNFYP